MPKTTLRIQDRKHFGAMKTSRNILVSRNRIVLAENRLEILRVQICAYVPILLGVANIDEIQGVGQEDWFNAPRAMKFF